MCNRIPVGLECIRMGLGDERHLWPPPKWKEPGNEEMEGICIKMVLRILFYGHCLQEP